jgi:hypothetical protein
MWFDNSASMRIIGNNFQETQIDRDSSYILEVGLSVSSSNFTLLRIVVEQNRSYAGFVRLLTGERLFSTILLEFGMLYYF